MDANSTDRRSRGGQPGNTNASLRHGFYRRATLTAHSLELLEDSEAVGGPEGVASLIDILRMEIMRLVESNDYKREVLAALAKALTSAELARYRMTGGDDKHDAMAALDSVLNDVRHAQEARDGRHPPTSP